MKRKPKKQKHRSKTKIVSESAGLIEDSRGAYYITTVRTGKKVRVIRHYV